MIEYRDHVDGITPRQLIGFFVGWPHPPSPETHLEILRRSSHVELALDRDAVRVVGFVNAVSDGVLSACIPLLEVLPDYQHQGIGSELVRRMLSRLRHLYMIDLTCDPPLADFYRRFGMRPSTGMMIRNFERQAGS